MLAGHIAHGGNILGEAKAGYRRANDKGQWWEAAASGKKGCERMPAGAPRKWKSVKAMQAAIDAYFKACEGEPFIGDDGCVVRDKYGIPIIINAKPPTITGLALALGFTGRQALIDYQARPEFADTVTRAKARCEEYAEARLYDRDGANGAKFSLSCNFGWREKAPEADRQEIGVVLMRVLSPTYVLIPGAASVWEIWNFIAAYSAEQNLTRDHVYNNRFGNIVLLTDGETIEVCTNVDPADFNPYQPSREVTAQ